MQEKLEKELKGNKLKEFQEANQRLIEQQQEMTRQLEQKSQAKQTKQGSRRSEPAAEF